MAKVWITYAWADNKDRDIDFLAQELSASGLTVKLDRWNIGAGKRLWEQMSEPGPMLRTPPQGPFGWRRGKWC